MVWECRALLLAGFVCCLRVYLSCARVVCVVAALLLCVACAFVVCCFRVRVCCLCVLFVGVVWPPQTCVFEGAVCCCVAAVSYSPTPSQVQYHRRCGA